jgi:AraC-like DNA-binding protein
MENLYEILRSGLHYNKFEVRELLFVEYSCPLEDESSGVWTQSDYLVHVLSGKKTWRTPQGSWTISGGQTLYIKKGAAIVNQFFDDEFCMLGFFISDKFIQDILKEVSGKIDFNTDETDSQSPAIEVFNDVILSGYFQSMLAYFSGSEKPSESLLELKLKELIINILSSPHNPALSSYFQSLGVSEKPSIRQIMETNFCYNLSLEDFAKLCYRSLSSFKRDFKKHYNLSPGKWLLTKRLDYSALLLKNSDLSISQIVFECGFEDLSHFSRAFKEKFGIAPLNFRKEVVA